MKTDLSSKKIQKHRFDPQEHLKLLTLDQIEQTATMVLNLSPGYCFSVAFDYNRSVNTMKPSSSSPQPPYHFFADLHGSCQQYLTMFLAPNNFEKHGVSASFLLAVIGVELVRVKMLDWIVALP
uniref:Uncharacterized protein n=1 Tax=Helianthus annuus TaxID=4232 RepID=A0A251SN33_HELAN